jgi:hypothetical protein
MDDLPTKNPRLFLGEGLQVRSIDRSKQSILAAYISTVSATSTNAGIWSKFI